jgi:hypothetical protein
VRVPIIVASAGLSLLLGLAAPAVGQRLVGVVVDQETGEGVAGAELVVRDTAEAVQGRAVSDDDGAFVIDLEGGGIFSLAVSRVGYQSFSYDTVEVAAGERVVLEVRLGVRAVPLEPVVVSARSRVRAPAIERFYERLERGRRAGTGHFFDRSDIEALQPSRVSDLLRRVSGVRVVPGRGGHEDAVRMRGDCIPALFIDGSQINRADRHDSLDRYVSTLAIEGVEVYRGPATAPAEYFDRHGCGVVLVWTRRGEADEGQSVGWKTVAAVVAAMLALLFVID